MAAVVHVIGNSGKYSVDSLSILNRMVVQHVGKCVSKICLDDQSVTKTGVRVDTTPR